MFVRGEAIKRIVKDFSNTGYRVKYKFFGKGLTPLVFKWRRDIFLLFFCPGARRRSGIDSGGYGYDRDNIQSRKL